MLTEILRFEMSHRSNHRSRKITACGSRVDTTPRKKMSASNLSYTLADLTRNISTCTCSTVLIDFGALPWTEVRTIAHRGTLLVASTPRIRVAKVIPRHRLLHSSKKVILLGQASASRSTINNNLHWSRV